MSFLDPRDFGFQGGSQKKSKSKRKKPKSKKKGKGKRKKSKSKRNGASQFSQFQQTNFKGLESLQSPQIDIFSIQGASGSKANPQNVGDIVTNVQTGITNFRNSPLVQNIKKGLAARKKKKGEKKVKTFEDNLRAFNREGVTVEGRKKKKAKTMEEVFSQNIRSKNREKVSKLTPGKEIGVKRSNGQTRIFSGNGSPRADPRDPDAFFIE